MPHAEHRRVVPPAGRPVRRRRFLRGCLALGASSGVLAPAAWAATLPRDVRAPREAVTRHAIAFGTRVGVTVAGGSRAEAAAAADAALAEVAAVDALTALHRPQSPLALLNRSGALAAAPPALVELLREAQRWHALSAGAFDVTVQPLWQAYFAASVRGGLPPAAQIERLLGCVDGGVVVAPGAQIALPQGVRITLNGIAQGYATDRAWAALRRRGVEHALVDAGEWRAGGSAAAGGAWQIGVRSARRAGPGSGAVERAGAGLAAVPLDVVALRDAALASSGIDGFTFTPDRSAFHILDPRTGRSPGELAGATVWAADACSADALSTACMVLGVERSLALAAQLAHTELLLERRDGSLFRTAGWPGA